MLLEHMCLSHHGEPEFGAAVRPMFIEAELLSELDGPAYLERVTVNNVKNVRNAKKAIKKAFQNQIDGKGFSLVEVLSSCPTNWGMTPQKALEWIDEKMIPYYPLGVYRDKDGENNG